MKSKVLGVGPTMDDILDAARSRLKRRVFEWNEREIGASGEQHDDRAARALVERLGRDRLLRYVVPREFGGARAAVQVRDLCVIRETLSHASPLADTMFALQALTAYPIALAGTAGQRAEFLPGLAQGNEIGAFALTEPQAGSDVASVRTRARKRGDSYELSGVKTFISNAGLADIYVVFASTQPARKGRGLSAFIIRANTPGLYLRERLRLISPHPIGTIELERCRVSASQRLGSAGEGLALALATLQALRCSVGAAAVGMAQRALDEALEHARHRRQFGRPLSGFQSIQFKLADMATELEAARLLVHRAATSQDGRKAGGLRASAMAKVFATEAAQRVVDHALQIRGSGGLVAGTVFERLYRAIRALRIYEGTSEIQKLVIARELLKQ